MIKSAGSPSFVRYVRHLVRYRVRHETRMNKGFGGMCGIGLTGARTRVQKTAAKKSHTHSANLYVPAHTAHTAHRLYSCGFALCAIVSLILTSRTTKKIIVVCRNTVGKVA